MMRLLIGRPKISLTEIEVPVAQFFKYFLDNVSGCSGFMELNKLYCPVSGFLGLLNSVADYTTIGQIETNAMTCGNLFKCCWPFADF